MKTWCIGLTALFVTHGGLAAARSTIKVKTLTADGVAVQQLECDLATGGFMAGLVVVGALAKQREALAACAPDGDAAYLSFAFVDGETKDVQVLAAHKPEVGACVQEVLAKVAAPDSGTCKAVVQTVDNDTARKAATALAEKLTPTK